MRARDEQRERCYAVEDMLAHLSQTGWLTGEYRFGDLDAVRRYVGRVMAGHPRYRGLPVPGVRRRRGAAKATYSPAEGVIALPDRATDTGLARWAMRSLVVDHEIAHHVAHLLDGTGLHDERWRARFVDVVRFTTGADAADLLADYYGRAGLAVADLGLVYA